MALLSIGTSVSPSKAKPGELIMIYNTIRKLVDKPEEIKFMVKWYLNNKQFRQTTDTVGKLKYRGINFEYPAPCEQGTHTIKAEVYSLSPSGEWILEDTDEAQLTVEGKVLTIKMSVSPSKVRPKETVKVSNSYYKPGYCPDIKYMAKWYLDNKKLIWTDQGVMRTSSRGMGFGFQAPLERGTHTIKAEIYRLSSTGKWILEDTDEAQFTVEGEPVVDIYIQSEDSTVSISGYNATIHGKVTIMSKYNTTVYPTVAYYGGKIILDPISVKAGTYTYTYTRTFNFENVYNTLRRKGISTDAEIWYLKSDKTTRIKGDTTKFKLEPTGVITPKAVVKITVDKTQIMKGERITGTATIESVSGISLPASVSMSTHGAAYTKDGKKIGFGTFPFYSGTLSSVPFTRKFSFDPSALKADVVRIDLFVQANIKGYPFNSNTVTVTIVEPKVTDWSVKADKTTVKPGDKLTIQATVNWVGKSMKFKLGIDAFGKHYESTEVTATASPATIKVPITVPVVKEGTYEIKVKLYYE